MKSYSVSGYIQLSLSQWPPSSKATHSNVRIQLKVFPLTTICTMNAFTFSKYSLWITDCKQCSQNCSLQCWPTKLRMDSLTYIVLNTLKPVELQAQYIYMYHCPVIWKNIHYAAVVPMVLVPLFTSLYSKTTLNKTTSFATKLHFFPRTFLQCISSKLDHLQCKTTFCMSPNR